VSDVPVSPAVVARAQYWNPILWNYGTKTIVKPYAQEQFGGRWLTFSAAWHPGDQGPQTYMATEAWRLASALPMPAPAVTPQPAVGPAMPPAGVTTPAQVSPYPGPGAYQSNAAYIARYQNALTFLSKARGAPTWDPKGVDGKYGPNTAAAVKAFQAAHHLTPVDGFCGAATAAALDQELGYGGAAPAPAPVPPPHPAAVPAVVVQPATPTTPAVLQQPAPVSPYPGPGAYQSNGPYITRYQNALTFLAHAAGNAAWDPQGVDGKYGPHTAAAVKSFQSSHGLTPVDGFCGAATAAALDAAVHAVAVSSPA
jgi:peptidoglycan hydrolase-like protein with peptidoglycan-binding domain